jgi:hypothetical protein
MMKLLLREPHWINGTVRQCRFQDDRKGNAAMAMTAV